MEDLTRPGEELEDSDKVWRGSGGHNKVYSGSGASDKVWGGSEGS
jgi:hypothetical protein